ncbi:hypothetical protein BH10CYA1_BH10CYA1_59770 [soil metagenome]
MVETKSLHLKMTDEQFEKLAARAKAVQMTPEQFVLLPSGNSSLLDSIRLLLPEPGCPPVQYDARMLDGSDTSKAVPLDLAIDSLVVFLTKLERHWRAVLS